MKKIVSIISLLSVFFISYSQDENEIHKILLRIEQQQLVSDPGFVKDIFPSYLSKSKHYNEKQKDNNVFYNALIGYTIKSLRSQLSAEDKIISDSISARSGRLFTRFKNVKGRNTYNFARTDTAFAFPFSTRLPKPKGDLRFPDDLDCTSLILLCQDNPDSTIQSAHMLMQNYVNKGKLKTTFRSYRKFQAYSSWYGKKFPVVFDVSVLCNILCFVQENDLPWTKADSASLQLIVKTIKSKDYISHPLFVSPYYGKESLILYHIARLMSVKPIAELEELKPIMATEASYCIARSKSPLEKIMLNSALMKWGYAQTDMNLVYNDDLSKVVKNSDFSFFVGNIPSYKRQPWKELLTDMGAMQYHYYCNAFNDALLLEYMVLLKKK
ncbi:MAG: hypothetical protein ACJ77K_11145 [Bacteroidia bacterium]